MKSTLAVLVSSLVVLCDIASAARLPVVGRRQNRNLVQRATNVIGNAPLTDKNDVSYYTNVTVGGLPFSVLIDTGSSDLWIRSADPIPGAVDTGATAGITYAVGQAQGPIQLAPLVFAGNTVPQQAFILVSPGGTDLTDDGFIGLGPAFGSVVGNTLQSAQGYPPLDNIFLQDTTTPNFLAFLLGRSEEPGDPFPGDIAIGEVLSGYEAVTSQPKLNVTLVSSSPLNQHWQSLTDEDGVIGPDGNPVSVTSTVTGASDPKQLTAIFDSGFSLPQVPKSIADAFYGSASGAQYTNITGLGEVWVVPCTTEINVAFKFGGQTYPIHPLDAVLVPPSSITNAQGVEMCLGSFQPISTDTGGDLDMILGMAFLRNTYTLINFGDFRPGSPHQAAPYIQLLSTTNDTAKAHADFVSVRGSPARRSVGEDVSRLF